MRTVWNLPRVEFIPFPEVDEHRPILLVTSPPAWNAVAGQLRLPARRRVDVAEATIAHWDSLFESLDNPGDYEVVYGVGGGLAADAAKYMAVKLDLPLVCLPTALSADAFLTSASGVRQDGCVDYMETKPPVVLLVDLKVIAAAPESLRAAGICDVLSIATGCWDWQFAHERNMNPPGMEFIPFVYDNAHSILRGALDCAAAAGRGDHDGLKQLLDCLALEVQLCNQIGHARPEEGSEHYFAYSIENIAGKGLPHGDLLGPGILAISRLQGQDNPPLELALRSCHIPLDRIPEQTIQETLKELPGYVRRHHLPYGIAHELIL
jgi:glycerol-1-phosphate dehydrogenase [NAD(P)+]